MDRSLYFNLNIFLFIREVIAPHAYPILEDPFVHILKRLIDVSLLLQKAIYSKVEKQGPFQGSKQLINDSIILMNFVLNRYKRLYTLKLKQEKRFESVLQSRNKPISK